MKRFLAVLLIAIALLSIACAQKEAKIEGTYSFIAEYATKNMFKDVNNTTLGDTNFIAGSVTLNWKTTGEVTGKNILIEKSMKNDSNWSAPMGIEVQTEGSFNEEIKEANAYFYKLSLDNSAMHTYAINVPVLAITSPVSSDTTLSTKGFAIVFNKLVNAEKYMIFVRSYKGDSIFSTETADTQITFDGKGIEKDMVYVVTVATEIVSDSTSKVKVSTTNQIIIKK